jgi:hydrogenase maturation protease
VVVCVGNEFRGDDGAGPAVATHLGEHAAHLDVVVCRQEPSRLLDAWEGADVAIVVDAVSAGAPPGTIHRFDASDHALPATVFRGSTHALGIGEVIELARALGRLPRRVLVYGIEGARFDAGEPLTPEVSEAVGSLAAELAEEAGCTIVR